MMNKVGAEFTVPSFVGTLVYRITDDDGETATIGRVTSNGEIYTRVSMPSASVKHFHDDLNDIIRAKPNSLVPEVNAVIRGEGYKVGKGNDGIVYAIGSKAVKVSTTVPYQPENAGHRSPKAAVAHTKAEFAAHQRLENLHSVPPATFIEHGGRGWIVKPFMRFGTPMTKAELDQLAADVASMHAMGLVLGDTLQVGRSVEDSRIYFSDLGQVHANRPNSYDIENDVNGVRDLYRDNGLTAGSELPKLKRQMDMWQRNLLKHCAAGDVEKTVSGFKIWWTAATAYSNAVLEVEGGLAGLDAQDAAWDIAAKVEEAIGRRLRP
jgi:hypothetical protein